MRAIRDTKRSRTHAVGVGPASLSCSGTRFTYLLVSVLLAVSMAFAPFDFHFLNSGMKIEKSKAIANPVITTLGADLLAEYAAAAGMSSSDFVVTVAGMVTTASGMSIATDAGIKYGNSLSDNLAHLIEAADYPAWNELSSSQQANYGTADNYNAVKFNTLLDAFGYGTVTDGFYASDGGNFELTDDLNERIKQIGNIGQRWTLGLANKFQDIFNLFTDESALAPWFPPGEVGTFDGTGLQDWPVDVPYLIPYVESNTGYMECNQYTNDTRHRFMIVAATSDVYFTYWRSNNVDSNGAYNTEIIFYSKSNFLYNYQLSTSSNPPTSLTRTASEYAFNGNTMYYMWVTFKTSTIYDTNIPILPGYYKIEQSDIYKALNLALFGGTVSGSAELIDGYPENVNPEAELYMPEDGLSDENTWDNFTDERDPVRPENPYNPNDGTDKDKWRNDTEANVLPLANIRFDKLFPFSLMYDLPKLVNKVTSLTVGQSSAGEYSTITIPVNTGYLSDEDLVIDLTPLHDLLVMIRPFNLILLIVALVMSLVLFWKSILTGD